MPILITGGAGFIAFHLASKLQERREQIAILDNFNDFYDPAIKRRNVLDLMAQGPAKLYEVDILDRNNLRRVFEEVRPRAVVHLAAWAGVRPSLQRPSLYYTVNVTGTGHILDLAAEFKTERFIFGSSSSVYGASRKLPFTEDDPADRPISPYAATKRASELLCHTYAHNYPMNITCLRFFTVYGPRQRPEMAIHKFARLLWEGEDIPVYGDGQSRRDYTYVDDIVAGIIAAMELEPGFLILNLGESETVSLMELIGYLERGLGKKARLRLLPDQPGDLPVTFADISRARQLLGYQPQTGIGEGIGKFVAWFMQTRTNFRARA
jgi:UDP-glucuronate 4-epimerase